MVRTLWLVSWYPSKASPQNGDLIQRQAYAVARFANVHVLYVVPFTGLEKKVEISFIQTGNLTEEIVLYRKKSNHFFGKCFSIYHYLRLYKKQIRHYLKTFGKPDVVHVQVAMRAGLFALWLKKKYHIPYVATERSTMYTTERKDNFRTQNFLFQYYAKEIFKHASLVLFASDGLGKNIQQMVANVPYIKIPNVVSDNFHLKKTEEILSFTFIHASTMNELKNPKGIIRAYAAVLSTYNNVLLKMVGVNYEPVQEYAKELGIPDNKIVFTGEISNEQVADEMKRAQVFVLFSYSETFCAVVAESLCCGVPVIATNVVGPPELIDNSNGILIPANDEQALVSAMNNMIKNYAHYDREKISERAKALYNYDVVGKKIVEVYQSVIDFNKKKDAIV
ncbi:MAG: glycosyltransferase [Chitinophagaceae bacterium]|jgi:glycosyltransferase involved in cell wall biosynthesis|nr:glycosyltransferase [Chitinophagaceae bacterium]